MNTITDPGKDLTVVAKAFPKVIYNFVDKVLHVKPGETRLPAPDFVSLSKSTPSITKGKHKVSWSPQGILQGAIGLVNSQVYHHFLAILDRLPESQIRINDFRKTWSEMVTALGVERSTATMKMEGSPATAEAIQGPLFDSVTFPIGKLGFKQEAAGKVRVFAMVEC